MPWGAIIPLALVLVGAGVLVIAIGRRAWKGELPRNYLAGIRTRATLASDQAWHIAHRASGPRLTLAGFGPLVVGVLLLARPSNGGGLVLVTGGLVWLVGWVVAGAARAHGALQESSD